MFTSFIVHVLHYFCQLSRRDVTFEIYAADMLLKTRMSAIKNGKKPLVIVHNHHTDRDKIHHTHINSMV